MKRRQVLQTIALAPSAFALNCSGPTDEGKEEKVTSPYYDPQIETDTSSTTNGATTLTTPSQSLEIRVENEFNQPLNSIDVSIISSPEGSIVVAKDPYQKYLPSILFPSNTSAKPVSWKEEVIRLYEASKNIIKDIAIKAIPEPLRQFPSHYTNPHYFKNMPFVIYQGDWSFNELRETFDLTKSVLGIDEKSSKLASVLTFLGELEGNEREEEIKDAATALSVVETGVNPTNFLNLVDVVLNVIEDNTSLNINRNKRYSWYMLSLGELKLPFVLPAIEKESVFDIKHYISTKPGNKWTFYSDEEGFATIESLNPIKIDGKDVAVFESFYHQEYYGFTNNELRLFGFYDYDVGNILFKPSILIGDNKITAKKSYSTNSNINFQDYPEITGTIKEILTYEGLDNIIVRAGSFGDCLKLKEITILDLQNKKIGESISERYEGRHWLARNVGKVLTEGKTIFSDGEEDSSKFELYSANVNNLYLPKIALQNNIRLTLPHLDISHAVKKILK